MVLGSEDRVHEVRYDDREDRGLWYGGTKETERQARAWSSLPLGILSSPGHVSDQRIFRHTRRHPIPTLNVQLTPARLWRAGTKDQILTTKQPRNMHERWQMCEA